MASHILRLYDLTESGRKIATMTAQPSSAQPTLAVTWPSFIRSRTAEITNETGLMFTNASSQLGSDSGGTNAFDRNVSGNMIIIEMPCTAWALRARVPR